LRNTERAGPAYAAGNAARTGRALEPVPLEPVVATLRMAGCRQPVMRVGAKRPNPVATLPITRPPVPKHQGTAHPSAVRGRPCFGVSRMPQGGSGLPIIDSPITFRCMNSSLRTPKTKRPRVLNPRAFALPREIGVTDLRASLRSVGVEETVVLRRPHARQRVAAIARGQQVVSDVERHGFNPGLFS